MNKNTVSILSSLKFDLLDDLERGGDWCPDHSMHWWRVRKQYYALCQALKEIRANAVPELADFMDKDLVKRIKGREGRTMGPPRDELPVPESLLYVPAMLEKRR